MKAYIQGVAIKTITCLLISFLFHQTDGFFGTPCISLTLILYPPKNQQSCILELFFGSFLKFCQSGNDFQQFIIEKKFLVLAYGQHRAMEHFKSVFNPKSQGFLQFWVFFDKNFSQVFLQKNDLYTEKIKVKFSQIYLTIISTLKIENMIYPTKKG